MAHQLSCDDEHSDGTINQYYRRYFPGACGRGRTGSFRACRNLVFGCLYAGLRIQHRAAGNDCPEKWGTTL